jgi:2'-5' RNA ligase
MGNDKRNMYFIALLPDDALLDKVRLLKEHFRDTYGPEHALKTPAHITLQRPFRRSAEVEPELFYILHKIGEGYRSFPVTLNGYGRFDKRVIYLQVVQQPLLTELQQALRKEMLHAVLGLKEVGDQFHPHMTIAHRDLSRAVFDQAWPELAGKEFYACFEANRLVIFRHNGVFWQIIREHTLSNRAE